MFLTDLKGDASECCCLDQYALIHSRSVRGIPRNASKQYQTCEPVRVCSTPAVLLVTFTHRIGCINIYTYTQKKQQQFQILPNLAVYWDTRWRSWLRHCATSRKVAGSIPDGVIGFF